MNTAQQIIHASRYREFPETLLTLELCRALAHKDGRKVGDSLRKCAKALAAKIHNRSLRDTLTTMSRSMFPETEMTRIRGCIGKMEAALTREVRGGVVTEDTLNQLREDSETELSASQRSNQE